MAFNRFIESDVKNRHTVDYHLDLLKGLGIQTEGARRGISVSPDRVQATRKFLSARGVGHHFAVIHPGAARSEKMWGVDNWIRTAEFLTTTANLDVVLTGGGHADELEQIGHILSRSSGRIFSVAGETTLDTLAATLALARIYVGVDTGAAHMADALGIPCAVLFGSTNPLHWGPRGEQGRAIGASGFSSYPHNFPKSSMQEIFVANVEAAIVSALSES
jgi:ADP-heptose:LPS heptosyltransferase